MNKYFYRFMIIVLLTFVSVGILGSGEVYASGGSFNVPQVNDHFEKVQQGPAPEKESSLSQAPKKENGTWDWITKPVSRVWKWSKEAVSSAWNKTKDFCSEAWDWICKVCDQITKVVVDGLSSAWDWIVKYKEYVAFTAVVIVGIALCLVPPLGEEILAGVALSFIMSVLMNGGKIDKNTFMDAAIGGLLGPIGGGIAGGVSRALESGVGRRLVTWLVESRAFGPLIRYGGKLISKLPSPIQKIFSKAGFIGSVEGAGTSISDDLLHGRKINWKMAFFAGLFGAGMVGVVSFAQPVIDKATASIKPLLAKIPIVKNLDNCFAYNQMPGYFAIATNSFEIKCLYSPDKAGTGGGGNGEAKPPKVTEIAQKDVIKYQDKPDSNGWYTPVKPPTPEELNQQTHGLYEQVKKDRQQLIEEITALQNDKEFQKKYSPEVISKLKVLKQKAKGKRPANFLAAIANIGGKEIQLKAFSGSMPEGLLKGWTEGSKQVNFKTMFTRQDLNYGFEEDVTPEKIAEILKNNGEKRLDGVTDRSEDTEPKVFSEISELLGEKNPGKETDKIVAFSEYDVCPSCGGVTRYVYDKDGNKKPYMGVIEQFAIKHPNVTIEMYDSKGRKLIRRGIDDFPELVFKEYPELVKKKYPDLYKKLTGGK
ncbi:MULTISPECIES: deaminase domain-containing protein [unclassified Thermoactinomyces]|uniref:deaminase domain-containing protein n=1 Tax=unclassified Thermoactinomyces TaxID=2634588 RepID=UPI0018DC8159|nr:MULTISPECIES: deaminase domain-containing protein [unclassified Thermoactinomyces]MBH8597481.1 hypothetical protein [Thermoactinomyces sp. CICC 10523]MBH8608569.1 hypothetical protein [Thermoactinomyces sp. CICC 10521]